MADMLDRDTVFRKMRSKPENKHPIRRVDLSRLRWGSQKSRCAHQLRQVGAMKGRSSTPHTTAPLPFRSTTLDGWSQEQLKLFVVGGNQRGRQFFKQHGWDDIGSDKIEGKYTSRAAQLYRAMLDKEAAKITPQQLLHSTSLSKDQVSQLADFKHFDLVEAVALEQSVPASTDANGLAAITDQLSSTGISAVKPPASSLAPKTRLMSSKKTTGKLGLKKMDNKSDSSLFEQAPAPEPVKVDPSTVAPASVGAGQVSAAASRFSYDTLNSEPTPAPQVQRGKDGHLTLNTVSSGNDFFSNPMSSKSSSSTSSAPSRQSSARPAVGPSAEAPALLKKLANNKAISSRDFENAATSESDAERGARLSKFSGASAISSSDYYGGNGPNGGGSSSGVGVMGDDMDISASDIVNRLSYQAKQDLQQVSQMAGAAAKKMSSMASKFLSDLSRPM